MEVGAECCGSSGGGGRGWKLKGLESDALKLDLRMNRQLEWAWSVFQAKEGLPARVL